MKQAQAIWLVVIVAVAFVAFGALMMYGPQEASVTGQITTEDGSVIGPWANTLVPYKMSVKNDYTGADVSATAKVYDVKPADWGNPRGTFDDASAYTSYSASSGIVTINDEKPGKYYVVMTASGYNTEFVEITIPDGTGRNIDISVYSTSPDVISTPMALVGSTTDVDFALTLVNDTSAELNDVESLKLADDTEFRGWKVIVNDQEGFSVDTDGDGVYDEGIKTFTIIVNGIEKTIFDPARGVDMFDSNDEYTFSLEGIVVADGDRLDVEYEIDAITSDSVGANDEAWGEGEGVLSYIKIYDLQGNLFATMDITA